MSDFPANKFFSFAELACKHTGKCEMDPAFMERLIRLRERFNHPMVITSGYRDKTHPVEANKGTSGAHVQGRAVDVAITGGDALRLIGLALDLGFTGVGVKQHGPHAGRFIHLDTCPAAAMQPRPTIWSYA